MRVLAAHRARQRRQSAELRGELDPAGYILANLATDPSGQTPHGPTGRQVGRATTEGVVSNG